MAGHLTLHVRLIKGCQADCSYCSSWQQDSNGRMSPADYHRALEYIIASVLPRLGTSGPSSTVSVQYVGGEILLVPQKDLRECVHGAREILGTAFGHVQDGVQSNLVASERRVMELDTLFVGNIGTSVDGRGTQRTIKGSADAYRKAVARSRQTLERRRRRRPGAIFVVDREGIGNITHEIETASAAGYSLVLRPVFNGGRSVNEASVDELVTSFGEAFDHWIMKSRVAVEPFTHLLSRRLSLTGDHGVGSVCPFQRNCSEVSLDIEPDGTLYTCLDMADSAQYPLGNALKGEFDWETWEMLRERKHRVDPKCAACPFFAACQGGCMSEAIHHTGSVYGRSDLCAVWTAIFERIDVAVARYGRDSMAHWMKELAA